MNENKFDESAIAEKCNKAIQDLMDASNFHTPVDVGKTLGKLIMQAVTIIDQVMGSEYTVAMMMAVAEQMASGEPQKHANIEMINRSKLN